MRERLTELSEVLWRQREALELVVFKLEEQRLLLLDGQHRWLCHASREVEAVLDRLGEMELCRAVAAAAAGAELDVVDDPRLCALAEAAPPPWPSVLGRHIEALRRLTRDIFALANCNRELLQSGLAAASEGCGSRAEEPSSPMLVDFVGFHAALSTNERLLHPSLVDAVGE